MGSSVLSDFISLAQIPFALLSMSGIDNKMWPNQAILKDNASYDYIVVGGGSAGCVVSRRLAEARNETVLMIEAGGNPPVSAMVKASRECGRRATGSSRSGKDQARVDADGASCSTRASKRCQQLMGSDRTDASWGLGLFDRDTRTLAQGNNLQIASLFALLPHSFVDHNFTSTRDDYAARSQNKYTMITAGKMLGGSASLNHFIHTRGSAWDYNCWAKLAKDPSWKYENILKYFKISERVDDDEILSQHGEFHGTDGPMGLTRQPEKEVIDILKAFAEVGNPTVLDLNADTYVGYTQPQLMLADKKRQTPAYTYLNPVKKYSNLHVSKHTRVTRIIFEGNVAVAIEAVYKGKMYTCRAKKEIILSAGVFNTPQLLMLSGIGRKEHLESFNIKVLKNLPVGDNLVDQVSVTVVYKLKKYPIPIPNLPAVVPDLLRFPFPIVVGSVAFNKSQTCPDYQAFNLFFAHDLPYLTIACATIFGLRYEICDRWQKQVKDRDSLYTVLALLQPKSRGTVRLESDDPHAKPVITTGYYTKKSDLKNMVKILKDHVTVERTEYFIKIGAELVGLDLPECAGKEKGSDEFWECYVLEHTGSPYHFTSTCPMGIVVDGKLRVKGVKRLRVVDASVIPKIPRAAPNAAVIMLAEKASDIIKNDNRYS